MSIKGSLEYQGLELLLRAELAAQGGGRLTLRHGAQYAALYLDEAGLYVLQPELLDAEMILDGFVVRGLLDPKLVTRMRRQHKVPGLLLDALVQAGVVHESEFMEILAREIEDAVLDMMLWEEGAYRFEREPRQTGEPRLLTRICVDPIGVAERALVRLDVRRDIGDLLGDHAVLFLASAGDLPPARGDTDRIHEVYAMLDGLATAPEIALRLGVSRFDVLRMLARLVEAGVARVAESDELARATTERSREGRYALARALVLQWAEMAPDDPAALSRLASLGAEAGDVSAQIEALCALGNLRIKAGEHQEALQAFTQAMRLAPADDVVLAGLRVTAEATGDSDALVDGTLLTAQSRLDEGNVDEALRLLEPLTRSHQSNMAVHLLRARALVQSEKRDEFFEQAEIVGEVLTREGCRTPLDRELVQYFRDTIVQLAPDRGDLLERFRAIYDPRRLKRRGVALAVALVALLLGAAVHFWPASAGDLLQRAHEAAEGGDADGAIDLISKIVEQYPGAPEAQEALRLQARLVPSPPPSNRARRLLAALQVEIEALIPAFTAALPSLPDPEAQAAVRAVSDPLTSAEAKELRKPLLEPHMAALAATTERLHAETIERAKVLGETATVPQRLAADAAGLRDALERAASLRDADWIARAKASAELLYTVASLHGDTSIVRSTQELGRGCVALEAAAAYHDEHIASAQLAMANLEIAQADRRCREEAPKLMVDGHLDRADGLYAHLEGLMDRCKEKPEFAELLAGLEQRQLPQLIRERRGQIADIRKRLSAAQRAEDAGDLEQALSIYTALVKEYWLIRFENVCMLPIRIVTVPAGARVSVGERFIGTSPVVLRYAWGSATNVRIEAPGFVTVVEAIDTAAEKPASALHRHLAPALRWSAPVTQRVHTAPLDAGDCLVVVDRQGLVTSHDRKDGHLRWTRDLSSLEGIRARPVLLGKTLIVARVDGRVFVLDAREGRVLREMKMPRGFGDLAAVDSHVGLATTDGRLMVLEVDGTSHGSPLEAVPTAGVVAAHGCFWVGTAKGTVVRLSLVTRRPELLPVTHGSAPVRSLVAFDGGVLVTTSDGVLLALGTDGHVLWKRTSLGDLVGMPAQAGTHVLVAERSGLVHVLDAKDGLDVRVVEMGGRSDHGFVVSGTTVLTVRTDGRFWAYDPALDVILIDADMPGEPRIPPAALEGGELVLPLQDHRIGVIATPRAP